MLATSETCYALHWLSANTKTAYRVHLGLSSAYYDGGHAAKADAEHAGSIVVGRSLLSAKDACKVCDLAQRQCIKAHYCKHNCIHVGRPAPQPEEERECYKQGLQHSQWMENIKKQTGPTIKSLSSEYFHQARMRYGCMFSYDKHALTFLDCSRRHEQSSL